MMFFKGSNSQFFLLLAALLWLVFVSSQSCEQREESQEVISQKALREVPEEYKRMMGEYVGSESCKRCHEAEYADWKGSHHDKAMMVANDSSVLGDFDNVTFESMGVTHRFYREGDGFFVNTEGPDGTYGDYEILYTYGITPLQQYIVAFPGGRFQCLKTAYDTEKGEWFDLYPDYEVHHDEWLHWTNGGLNWNTMCSDCHSTLVRKGFDPQEETYNTTYSIINVSCEACHGPARQHVDIAEAWEKQENPDTLNVDHGLYMTKFTKPKELVDQCARCHSLRTQFTEYYDHQGIYMDHYAPDLLRDGVYFADGQILGEVYVYGSFLQSEMYKQNVTCRDCHNSHSMELKFEGNTLCAQCHEPAKYDTEKHHFHNMGTEAAQCITCHMPGRYYMGNDFRRDHSFRVPRPDLALMYDTPDVCADCHTDSLQWAADAIVEWYGPERKKHFSDALAFGRTRDPAAIPGLAALARNSMESPMARSTAVWYLSQMPSEEAVNTIIALLNDYDPLVRYTSAGSLEFLPREQRREVLEPLLSDAVRSVRIAAASAMADVPANLLDSSAKAHFEEAKNEFLKGVRVRADFPGGQMELARYHEKTGRADLAEQAYLKAIELDNYYNTARVNLAGLYYGQRRFDEAEVLFKKVIEQEPDYGQAYYSLGLLLAEQNRMLGAEKYLRLASEKMNDNPRVAYNYGLVLQQLGKRDQAEAAFLKGLEADPYSAANLYGLTYLYFEQNKLQQAYSTGQQLVNLEPANENYLNLLNAIRDKLNVRN